MSARVFQLLNTFSKAEWKSFRKLLQSPFFTEQKDLLPFADKLYAQIGSGKAVAETPAFRRRCFELNRLGLLFLQLQATEQSPALSNLLTVRALRKRKLQAHAQTQQRKLKDILHQKHPEDPDTFLFRHLSEEEKHLELLQLGDRSLINLEAADQSLDLFYLNKKLRYYCDALNYQHVRGMKIEVRMAEELIPLIEKMGYLDHPEIGLYYQVLKTLSDDENEEQFNKLRDMLDAQVHVLPRQEQHTIYIFAQNYCIRKINEGATAYYRELFELYRKLLETGLLMLEGELVPWDYKNIITLGLSLQEYDWTEQFIHEQVHFLPKEAQQNALSYNLATFHFYKKNHSKVIELLREVEYDDLVYALGSKWLLLRTYYEIDEFDALDSLLESFRIFLQRSKSIGREKKRQYLGLIRFVRKLSRILPGDSKAITNFRQQLADTKAVANREWLLAKVRELGA